MSISRYYKTFFFIVILISCLFSASTGLAATGTVNYNTVYQQLEGFGGAVVYDVTSLASHPQKEAVYDLLFRDLGLDVLRIRNSVGYDDSSVTATKSVVAAARQSQRNPALKTELVPWSPPGSLKSGGIVEGGTLAKSGGLYVYDAYATWWADSLDTWASGSNGLTPDYISIQNEPDIATSYDSCRFDSTENTNYAGYDKAFEAVYNAIYAQMGLSMPKMLAPETMGYGNSQAYISALVSIGQINNIYGFSHHLYSDGSYSNPDNYITGMTNYAANYGYKPLFMTEFIADGTPTFDHALKLVQHIYNSLVYEKVTSYYHWSMIRAQPSTGGAINLSSSSYEIRDLYWFLKHYAYFTDPGWYRIGSSTDSSSLRLIAFKNPENDQLTIVIINISSGTVSLNLAINNFSPVDSEVYRSSSTEHWLYLGAFVPSQALSLPANSITTIALSTTAVPQKTLTISSTAGGNVTTPGEGIFQYNQGSEASIIATADLTYHFVNWTGTAVTAGKVANPDASSTIVTMDANYTVAANFEADPPSTGINIIGSWTSGLSHSREAGSNRALIFIAHGESTADMNLASVTYGGQPMTKVIARNYSSGGGRAYAVAYILKEPGIAAATGSTFSPIWSPSATTVGYSSAFFSNVDQTSSIGASASGGSTTNPVTTSSLNTNDGDMVIDAATCGQAGSYTLNNSFVEGTDQTMSNTATGVAGHKSATGVSETPSATYSGSINRQVIIGFVIKAGAVTCPQILAAGYGLLSDISGDCYVNFEDLEIIYEYWLNTDCATVENCDGADLEPDGDVDFIDFSDFAEQWMQCNDPQNLNCIPNW